MPSSHIVKQSGDEKINAPVYNETCINRRVMVTPVINTSGAEKHKGWRGEEHGGAIARNRYAGFSVAVSNSFDVGSQR